ncbi:MAG: antitoxin [Mycolicibacterium sp.]|uniref:type II toxin-antitoxin system antitoxin MazE7 n=1 Tax=Mycolicibacterium sp. TaxID=2320850 RepID=UPI003D122E70
MSTKTTTVRVSVPTRDRLAAQARQRDMSIADLLKELADQAERQAAFAAERAATLTDAANPAVKEEDHDWDTTAGDGID